MSSGRGGARYDQDGNLLTGRKAVKERRVTRSATMLDEHWKYLKTIGSSYGKAIEMLIDNHKIELHRINHIDEKGELRVSWSRDTESADEICESIEEKGGRGKSS